MSRPGRRFMKGGDDDLFKRKCLYCKKEGHFAVNCPEKKKVELGLDTSAKRRMTTCLYYEMKGHTMANCFRRKDDEKRKDLRRANAQNPKGRLFKKINALSDEKEAEEVLAVLMHTPVTINGVRFPKYLVDTGAAYNMISLRDVIARGFAFDPDTLQ